MFKYSHILKAQQHPCFPSVDGSILVNPWWNTLFKLHIFIIQLYSNSVRRNITVKLSNTRCYMQEINRKIILRGNYRKTNPIYQHVFHWSCSDHFREAGAGAMWGHKTGVWVLYSIETLLLGRQLTRRAVLARITHLLTASNQHKGTCTHTEGFCWHGCLSQELQLWSKTNMTEHSPVGGGGWNTELRCDSPKLRDWDREMSRAGTEYFLASFLSMATDKTVLPLNCVFQCIITCLLAG